jgi:hypothetical protein
MPDDLTDRSLRDLLATHVAVLKEIQRRGLSRTRGSLAGELGERITLAAYGGTLETAGRKSIDLIDAQGRTIQVKTRALDPGVHRIFAFSSFDFDLLVAIMLDANTFEIQWARELTSEQASSVGRYRVPSRDWAIATSKVQRTGIDITNRMRQAYLNLDSLDGIAEGEVPDDDPDVLAGTARLRDLRDAEGTIIDL